MKQLDTLGAILEEQRTASKPAAEVPKRPKAKAKGFVPLVEVFRRAMQKGGTHVKDLTARQVNPGEALLDELRKMGLVR